jgi:hypothetical protein
MQPLSLPDNITIENTLALLNRPSKYFAIHRCMLTPPDRFYYCKGMLTTILLRNRRKILAVLIKATWSIIEDPMTIPSEKSISV